MGSVASTLGWYKGMDDKYKAVRVIGIDPSKTSTGIVVLEAYYKPYEVLTWCQRTISSPVSGLEGCVSQVEDLIGIIREFKPTFGVIENYAFGNRYSLATLVELGTCFRLALRSCGVKYAEVAPSSLKKFATGNGRSKKVDIADKVLEQWQFESKSDDIVDAYVLARIGLAVKGFGDLNKAQNEVTTMVRAKLNEGNTRKR